MRTVRPVQRLGPQRGDAGAANAAIARYRIRWAILRPDRPLVGLLMNTGWKETYRDDFAVVLAKP